MNSEQPKNSIQNSILEKIKQENIRMRPRSYFVARVLSIVVLTLLVLIFSVLICDFVFFTLRVNGHDQLLSLGGPGITLFFQTFPWPLLVVDIVLIAVLQYLLRQFRFGYRSPWLYLILILGVLSISGGFALDRGTPFDNDLLHQADQHHLPGPFNTLFSDTRHAPVPGSGEYRGTVTSIGSTTFTLASYQTSTTTALTIKKPTQGPDFDDSLRVGESVIVIGSMQGGVVQAFGVRPLDSNGLPPDDQDSPHPH